MDGRVAGIGEEAMGLAKSGLGLVKKGAGMYGAAFGKAPLITGTATVGGLAALYAGYKALNPGYAEPLSQDMALQINNQQQRGQGQSPPSAPPSSPLPNSVPIKNEAQIKRGYSNLTYQDYEKERFRLIKEQDKIKDQLAFNDLYQQALS